MYNVLKMATIGCMVLLVSTSCSKSYSGDPYNFDNSLPPYVELKSKDAIQAKEGAAFDITAQVRTALQQVASVNYTLSGAINQQGVIKIDRNVTEGTLTIPVPAGTLPAGSTSGTATLKLVTASTPVTPLTVGRLGTEKETVTINITK